MVVKIEEGTVENGQRVLNVHRSLNWDSHTEAMREGLNFSRWLEARDPSENYKDGSDAFERQLAAANIVTVSDAGRGKYASELRAFEKNEHTRALLPEFLARVYRQVALMDSRSIMSSDLSEVNTALRPYVQAAGLRAAQIAPSIPVADLVALTTQIDTNAYRALYMNDDAKEYTMVRVGETAEVPAARLTAGERPVDLYKYGRRFDISYEALRRTPVDTVAFYLARAAIQAEVDKALTVLNVLVNGDGNSGTAAQVINRSTLETGGTNGLLTLRAWLAFKLKFKNPYMLTTELVREDVILQQMLLNTGSANIPLLMIPGTGFGGFAPINDELSDQVRYGVLDQAPSGKIVAFDKRFAVERVTEIGGTITESQRWIERQVQTLVFTEVEGYAVIDSQATKVLDLNA